MKLELATLDLIVKATALVGAGWGAIRYFIERRRDRELRQEELAWRKTEFVFKLAQDFDQDERMQRCVQVIEFSGRIPDGSSLERILSYDVGVLRPEEWEKRYEIDRFLDFFDRLYHFAFVTKVLTIPDLEPFLWFIRRIGETAAIREYCIREGYADILVLKKKCDEYYKQYSRPLTPIHEQNCVKLSDVS